MVLAQFTISDSERPQPMYHRPISASWHKFTQGDAIRSVID